MPKQARDTSKNVTRSPSHNGAGTIIHFEEGWKSECDAYDPGRKTEPQYQAADRKELAPQPFTGTRQVHNGFST
jgi:hypothetical protein